MNISNRLSSTLFVPKTGDLVAVVKGGVLPITIGRWGLEAIAFTYVGTALLAFASEKSDSGGSDDSEGSEDSDDSDDQGDEGDEEEQEANDNSDSERDEESRDNCRPSPLDCYKNMQDLLRNPTLLQPLNLI